jgi:hypothetical protein
MPGDFAGEPELRWGCVDCRHVHSPLIRCEEYKAGIGNMLSNIPDSGTLSSVVTKPEPASIPLSVQERLFECEYQSIVRQIAMWLFECEEPERTDFDAELRDLALSRLRSGFEQYGSEMYTWDAETRRRNVMEELADAIVHLTSGSIE